MTFSPSSCQHLIRNTGANGNAAKINQTWSSFNFIHSIAIPTQIVISSPQVGHANFALQPGIPQIGYNACPLMLKHLRSWVRIPLQSTDHWAELTPKVCSDIPADWERLGAEYCGHALKALLFLSLLTETHLRFPIFKDHIPCPFLFGFLSCWVLQWSLPKCIAFSFVVSLLWMSRSFLASFLL